MSGTISSESADNVEKILRRIIKENLSVKLFQEQLFKCIPDTILSKKTSRNLIIYVLDEHEIKPTKCKLLLQYIIGLLEYNLINYDAIDTFYYNYYKLLSTSGSLLVPLVCQLIYMLTKDPKDLLRLLVLRIKEGFKTNAVPKSLTCLLTLIKSLRPDLVPERIPAYSIEHAFRLLPINFRNDLEKVKSSHTLSENVSVDIQWRLANANKKDLIKLIPDLSLINVGSLYDTNLAEKTLIEYDNLIELHSEKCSAKNVANSMALLNNFAGVHFLTHEYDTVLKKRLIYSLQQQLRYEISQFTPTSIKNLKELFKSINNLYDCTQQGIPELSNLILEYFKYYRNFQIDRTILNLLSWTVITSFDDLHTKLLEPFLDVFTHRYLLSDQLDMIDCLSDLVVNFVTTCAYPELTELKQPFPLPEDLQQEDYMEIFRKLCLWINDFSLIAMKLDKDGLLGSILNLYHTLYDLQSHLESFVICAPPPCVVYACLGGMPFHHVNSCCKLLLRYVEICENTPDAKEVFEIIKKYITTFLKIFNGRSVEISSDTGQYLGTDLRSFINENKLSYGINMNLFLMPYVVNFISKKQEVTFDTMLNICKLYHPYVYQFLKEFLSP